METKFTPGPWGIYTDQSCETWIESVIGGKTIDVCMISNNKLCDREVANAHLIATAPELYKALSLVYPRVAVNLTIEEDFFVRDTIAKATGQNA